MDNEVTWEFYLFLKNKEKKIGQKVKIRGKKIYSYKTKTKAWPVNRISEETELLMQV